MTCLLYLNDARRRVSIQISKESHLWGKCQSAKGLKPGSMGISGLVLERDLRSGPHFQSRELGMVSHTFQNQSGRF